MWQRFLATVIVLALVAAGGYYAYHMLMGDEAAAEEPLYAAVAAKRGDLLVTVEGFGNLNPIYSANIQTEVGGFLESLTIGQGDVVYQGQVVGHMRNEEVAAQMRSLELELERKTASLAGILGVSEHAVGSADAAQGISLVAPISGKVVDLRVAENDRVERGSMIARIIDDARVVIVAEFTPAQFSHVEDGMQVQLRPHGFSDLVAATVVDANPVRIPRETHWIHTVTVEADNPGLLRPGQYVDILVSELVSVRAAIDRFYDETVVWSPAEGTVSAVYAREWQGVETGDTLVKLGGADTQKFIYDEQMAIRELHEQLDQKRRLLDRMDIRAPIDGVVAWSMRDWGHTYELQPGQTIASIIDNTRMALNIRVDEIDIVHIEEGMEATVTVEAFPGEIFPALVQRVDFMGHDEQGITVYGVYLEVEQTRNIRPGMSATVSVHVQQVHDVLLVPIEAVYSEDGQAFIDILEDAGPISRPVQIGLIGSRYAQVREGVEEGEMVVTGSSGDLIDSERVEPVEPPIVVPGG